MGRRRRASPAPVGAGDATKVWNLAAHPRTMTWRRLRQLLLTKCACAILNHRLRLGDNNHTSLLPDIITCGGAQRCRHQQCRHVARRRAEETMATSPSRQQQQQQPSPPQGIIITWTNASSLVDTLTNLTKLAAISGSLLMDISDGSDANLSDVNDRPRVAGGTEESCGFG